MEQHGFAFTKRTREQLKEIPVPAREQLFRNFIKPLLDGYLPEELRGKYKPNWEFQGTPSPMRQSFLEQSKLKNIYHYHFGYKMYTDGRDERFPGDVSDGITHNRVEIKDNNVQHVIIDICLKHPSPFKTPYQLYDDKAVGF